MCRRSVYSNATQLNSTRLTCFALIGCTLQLCQLHCRSSGVYSDATQLNSTQRRIELSCVAINGPSDSPPRPKPFCQLLRRCISNNLSTIRKKTLIILALQNHGTRGVLIRSGTFTFLVSSNASRVYSLLICHAE